uniref:Zmp:0000001082 n=1 Tax=Sinocyclocheilus grahami TaxID=75366 RepID=A0A672P0M3_SINGR
MNRKMFVTQTSSSGMEALGLILFMWASLSGAFNIDTEHPLRFNGTPEDFFGYSVYQTEFGNRKQIIVGAPLEGNSTGEMYSCSADLQSCKRLQRPGSESVHFFGMSAAVSSASLTSCSPYFPHECDGNSYLNGVCYQFSSSLQAVSNFTAAYQECTKREVNLVFLFDGSSSMKTHEFEMNKKFIKDVMKKLSNSSIKFAAVQFSTDIRTVFDFNDYQNGSAEEKLMKEKHMKSLTNTYRAINYVLKNLLNNVLSGADLNAQKALVIITDGDPSDNDDYNVLNRCDEHNILRYIIGVGKVDLTKLTQLASEPKQNNTFYIQEYKGLKGLLDNLQKKIYNIEGSKQAHGRDRQRELSQSGFSVVYQEDSVIVGSVGSNDWRGALYEVTGSGSEFRETEINPKCCACTSFKNLKNLTVQKLLTGIVYIYIYIYIYIYRRARSVLPGLQQFGVSLSGHMDMNDDNLTDIVIGTQGGIVLLKARPVMSVSAQLSFSPMEISLNYFECPGDNTFNAFNLTSCFTVTEQTSSTGSLEKSLNVSLNLNVDVVRGMNRGFFDQRNLSSRTLQKSVLLDSGFSCFSFSIFMLRCVADTVSPLKIRMYFSQSQMLSGNSVAVLDIHSRTEEYVEVPFQRNCNSNNSCVADLKLNFNFMNDTLVVVNQAHFTVLVSLANPGDDSFNTSIVLHYPEGLSLAKFDAIKPSRTRSSCGDRDSGASNRTTCSINLPVYRSGTTTQFLGTFRVTKWDYDWSDWMEMTITANSDNNGNMSDTAVRRSIPVQFSVDLAISLQIKPNTMSTHDESGAFDTLMALLMRKQHCIGFISSYSYSMIKDSYMCVCVCVCVCKYSFYEFRRDSVFNISAELHYNTSRYNQTSTELKTAVKVEFVVPPSRMLIVGTGVVGGFIFLIIILFLLLKVRTNQVILQLIPSFTSQILNPISVCVCVYSPLMNVNAKENRVSENDSTEKENEARETSPSPDPPNTDE